MTKMERELDQMKDEFGEAIVVQDDLRKEKGVLMEQLEKALEDSMLFKNKLAEEQAKTKIVMAGISKGEEYSQKLEQQNLQVQEMMNE